MSKIWALESCPKCKGNLIVDRDDEGYYESCILCGYIRYFPMQRYKSGQKEEPQKEKEKHGRNNRV